MSVFQVWGMSSLKVYFNLYVPGWTSWWMMYGPSQFTDNLPSTSP